MAGGQTSETSSRRVVGIVAVCAVVAVAAIVGGTVLLSRNEHTARPGAITKPRPGTPVLQIEVDPHSALGRAANLLNNGHLAAAAAIFRSYATPEAKLGLAFTQWSGPRSLGAVNAIVAASPGDPAMSLNLGWADFQAGHNADAATAWQQTASKFPDSPYAVDALDALHPGLVPGLPPIVVDPSAVPAKARPDLEAGVHAWDLRHVVTARRLLDAAARLAPDTPETVVAAAVALFSPASPLAPFPHLGPLTATFAGDSIVRLHLGLLFIWTKQLDKAKAQLRLASAEQPSSIYAKQARLLLKALGRT